MRAKELITELFDRPINFTVTTNSEYMYTAEFDTSSGLHYTVNIGIMAVIEDEASDILCDIVPDEYFDALFEHGIFIMFDQGGRADITGTGSEIEVLSTVVNIIGSYVHTYHPQIYSYHAAGEEPAITICSGLKTNGVRANSE
jgi:hypothetical protein